MTAPAAPAPATEQTEQTERTAHAEQTEPSEPSEPSEPLVIFGDASIRYDFGPQHPLTPRRFGPGIDLLRSTGARRFRDPAQASDAELGRLHDAAYLDVVVRFSGDPDIRPQAGIGPGDCPPFADMHRVSATVAGGSITAMDAILSGDALRAVHPGGGLHHAMAGHASGFCIYNDVALAVARARDAGNRVLYVDLDVHHGDGVQALFWDDPEVLTYSIHETGLSLFPGTGFVDEAGGLDARGTAVNVPLEPYSGDRSWLEALRLTLPPLAAAFRPDILVSQHGCDSHLYDPLAHLRVTTAAYWAADTLLDEISRRHTGGRWLATGGGGYDAYRVVPRAWSLVWLAQAGLRPPESLPTDWIDRWTDEADAYGQAPLPQRYLDPGDIVAGDPPSRFDDNRRTAERALTAALERLS